MLESAQCVQIAVTLLVESGGFLGVDRASDIFGTSLYSCGGSSHRAAFPNLALSRCFALQRKIIRHLLEARALLPDNCPSAVSKTLFLPLVYGEAQCVNPHHHFQPGPSQPLSLMFVLVKRGEVSPGEVGG